MSNAWSHLLCDFCWLTLHKERTPVRLRDAEEKACCKCGALTTSGIYVRAEPKKWVHCGDGGHDD